MNKKAAPGHLFFRTFREIYDTIPKTFRGKYRRLVFGSFIFSILDLISIAYLIPAILLLINPEKLSAITSRFGPGDSLLGKETIVTATVALVLFYILKNVAHAKFNTTVQKFLYGFSHALSMKILRQYASGDYLAFQNQPKGELLRNTTAVARDFSVTVLGSVIILMSESLTFLVIISFLLFFYLKLTMAALAVIGIFSLILFGMKKKEMRLANTVFKDASSKSNAEVLNILEGYIEIKSSGNQDAFLERFHRANEPLANVTAKLNAASGNYPKYMEIFLVICIAAMIFYSTVFGQPDNLMLISVLAAVSIKLLPSLNRILNAATLVNSHLYTVPVIKTLSADSVHKGKLPDFKKEIRFEDISFNYPGSVALFSNLDLTVIPGTVTGIKGVTGVGKTTLLHILAGLMPPSDGKILIDGKKIVKIDFLPFVSYVSQHPFLFQGTIIENVTMLESDEKINRELIDSLAEKLELLELFKNLPNGVETVITHNSSGLSGGQKQRLAILRALYHKPKLLILDEATNQQNESLEDKIYLLLQKLARDENMAIVTVSHNLDIYRYCDRIFHLSGDRLHEMKGRA